MQWIYFSHEHPLKTGFYFDSINNFILLSATKTCYYDFCILYSFLVYNVSHNNTNNRSFFASSFLKCFLKTCSNNNFEFFLLCYETEKFPNITSISILISEAKTLYQYLRKLRERRSIKFGAVIVSIEECRLLIFFQNNQKTTIGQ